MHTILSKVETPTGYLRLELKDTIITASVVEVELDGTQNQTRTDGPKLYVATVAGSTLLPDDARAGHADLDEAVEVVRQALCRGMSELQGRLVGCGRAVPFALSNRCKDIFLPDADRVLEAVPFTIGGAELRLHTTPDAEKVGDLLVPVWKQCVTIEHLFVPRARRGQGVATAAIKQLLKAMTGAGYAVAVHVYPFEETYGTPEWDAAVHRLHAFYSRLGFEIRKADRMLYYK